MRLSVGWSTICDLITTSLGRFPSCSPAVRRWQVFLKELTCSRRSLLRRSSQSEACVSGLSLFITAVIQAFVNGITVCGQLEVSKFWSVVTKKNKLEELQINTHVGDLSFILLVVSVFYFFLTRATPKMTLFDIVLLFKLLLYKRSVHHYLKPQERRLYKWRVKIVT